MTNSTTVQRTRRGQSGSAADVAVIADLVFEKGFKYREAAAFLGWTYSRVSEAARAYKGMESDNRGGRDARGREKAEHNVAVAQMTTRTTIVPDVTKAALAEHVSQRTAATVDAIDPVEVEVAVEAPKRRRRRLPTPDEVRAKAADDLLTVDWSNWLSSDEWERVAPVPAEIWGEDEDGEAVLSHLAVDPGVLWPVGWEGPRSWQDVGVDAPPARPARRRIIATSAQNRTPVHGPAWINLQALAVHYGADILIGGYTYGKGLSEAGGRDAVQIAPWSSEIAEGVTRRNLSAEDVVVRFAADLNLTPTISRPTAGLASIAKGRSMIVPHPRRALESIPRPQDEAPVHIWSTGAITVPNYVLRAPGIKAIEAHCIGCVMIEEDLEGRIFVRDITFNSVTGEAYDLDVNVLDGVVWSTADVRRHLGIPGPVIAWGDIHEDHLNADCARVAWGMGGAPDGDISMVDALAPSAQVVHDLLNFTSQSHHGRDCPWQSFAKHQAGTNLVEPEIASAATLLTTIARDETETLVVLSNHDEHFGRWLRETDWRADVANAEIHLAANLAFVAATRDGQPFCPFSWAIRRARPDAEFKLVTVDETERLFEVHYSFHGDRGPNGARGSTVGLARMGQAVTKMHDHTLTITADVRSGGCMVDWPDYARGPTTWAHGCVVGHADGSRQTVQFVGGKWRA